MLKPIIIRDKDTLFHGNMGYFLLSLQGKRHKENEDETNAPCALRRNGGWQCLCETENQELSAEGLHAGMERRIRGEEPR